MKLERASSFAQREAVRGERSGTGLKDTALPSHTHGSSLRTPSSTNTSFLGQEYTRRLLALKADEGCHSDLPASRR